MKNTKKPKYLGVKSSMKGSPDNFILDCVENPHPKNEYSVRFSAPEFTVFIHNCSTRFWILYNRLHSCKNYS